MNRENLQLTELAHASGVYHSYRIYQTPMGYKHVSICDRVSQTCSKVVVKQDVTCVECKDIQQHITEYGVTLATQLGTPADLTKSRVDAIKKGVPHINALNGDFYDPNVPAALSSGIMKSAFAFLTPVYDITFGQSGVSEYHKAKHRFVNCCLKKTPDLCDTCFRFADAACATLEVNTTIAVVRIVATLYTNSQRKNYLKSCMYPPHLAKLFCDLIYIRNKVLTHSEPDLVADDRMIKKHMLFPGWARIRPKLMEFYLKSIGLCEAELLREFETRRGGGVEGQRDQIFNCPMDAEDWDGIYTAMVC